MSDSFPSDLKNLRSFLVTYSSEIIVVASATLFMILNEYHQIGSFWVSSLIYFAALPIATILIVLRKNPLNFGLRIGNVRLWSAYALIFLLIAIPILYLASDVSSVQRYYTKRHTEFAWYAVQMAVYFLGWEFLFRGFMLFGLKDKFREGSILIQMIPFALLHIGKPEIETISTILSGIVWGYICYRGNSFWPAYIMHLVINVSNKAFISFL
ncbi:MAG: CPBP family intramembrane glutamic endopeptidase [Deltaproteobacteria bacterium]